MGDLAAVRWHEYRPWNNPDNAPTIPTGCGGCGLAEADHPYLAWAQTRECVEALRTQLDEALDALELMVQQYLYEWPAGQYDHSCMSAGEDATEVLLKYRPEQWEPAPRGLRRKPPGAATIDKEAGE